MTVYHSKLNEKSNRVSLQEPSKPTALSSWMHTAAVATVVPERPMPPLLNGVAFAARAPRGLAERVSGNPAEMGWEAQAAHLGRLCDHALRHAPPAQGDAALVAG